MAWFHKSPWRNTTGQSISGNLVLAGQSNSTAPRPGGWHASAATDRDALAARGHPTDQGQLVEAVKRHVAHCQAMALRQQALPAAETKGRCASFFKAAVRDLGACLGAGMGRTRQAEPAWQRPDRETVPAQRVRPDPGAMKNLVHDGSLLRKADKTVAELERVEAQLRGVHELIRTTPPAAAPRRQEVLRTWLNLDREHQTAKAGVAQAKRQYDMAKQEYKLGSQEGWRLTNAIRQQRAVQQTTLTALQSSRPQPANLTPGSRSQRAHRTLEACSALHRQSSAALNKAQAQLRQATSQGSPSTALLALNETRQELSERCKKHQSMRDRAQAIVDRLSGNHANDAAQESGPGTSNRANENLETLREQLTTWLAQRNQQRTGLSKARRALEHARQGEQTARASLQEAQLQTRQVGSDASQPLDTECTTLTSLAQSLVEPLRQARATQAQQAQAFAQTQADRTEQLLQHPPGFEHGEGCSALSDELRSLKDRLQAAPPASRASDWPLDDTLAVVCDALALVSNGDAATAARTVQELTQREWVDLVPPPGQWFDGSPRTPGEPQAPTSPLEELIRRLNDLPCGPELLIRLVCEPGNTPSREQRDAMSVYHQAMRAVASPHTTDSASWMWLQCAALTACHIAHPAAPPVVLSAQQRAAFHGVRNGLTSVAPGSPYDQANRQLLRMSDDWVRDLHGNTPLKTRRAAATTATQVGLPTPIRQSNEALLKSCTHLQQAITAQLVQVRREAQQQGRVANLSAVEPLLQAACLLKHIQKHADRHLRVDQMPIGDRAWRSVDKHTVRWIKKEGHSAPTPLVLRAQAQRLGLPPAPQGAATTGPAGSALAELEIALLEMRACQSTALEAVENLHERLQPLLGAAPQSTPSAGPGPLPTILEEDQTEMAESERQDLISQTARDMGWSDAQKSLQTSRSMQATVDAFTGKKAAWTTEALPQWVTPVVGNNSSSMTMNHGHSVGLSTTGLSSVISRVVENAGVVVRLDADLSWTKQQQLRWSKQSRGMELFAGDQQQVQGRAGVTGGLGYALINLPTNDAVSVGAVASWAAGRSRNDTQGVLLRSPNDGERSTSQVKEEFSGMFDTLLGWRALRDEASDENYSSPLQAILARHDQVSVSTVEQLRTVANHTRSGLSASASGGGPISDPTLPGLFGTLGLSAGLTTERRGERIEFKTSGGSQGFDGRTVNTTRTVSAQLNYAGQLGGNVVPVGDGFAALRGRTSAALLQLDLHRRQVQSGTTVIRQPNGSLVGEKAREFNNFEAFQEALQPRWDEWIERGLRARLWPEAISPIDQRLLAAQELEDFMSAAADSVRQGGTVTLNETLEVRPEVCAELSACLALEELALAKGEHHRVQSLFEKRQQLLADDSSYQPYKLKAIVRSQTESALGMDLGLSLLRKQGASATHEYDSYPKT